MECSIIDYWFPNNKYQNFWFQGNFDTKSQEKIKEIVSFYNKRYELDLFWKSSKIACLEGIIYYDQFFRHIGLNNHEYNKKAVELCFFAIKKKWIPKEPYYLVFFLMPLRHTLIKNYIDFCKDIIISENKKTNSSHYTRFLNCLSKIKEIKTNILDVNYSWLFWTTKYNDVLCDVFDYEYQNNKRWLFSTKIWKAFIDFILSRKLNDSSKNLIISLSGGVDSMVFLYLCQVYKTQNEKFIFSAVHINWNQRNESIREAQFIIDYCTQCKINLEYQNIDYLDRKINRQLFEDEGRKIRFNIYKDLISKTNSDSVFLGHHCGDIIENVFTNMVRGLNYLHLGKMEKEMIINDVILVRPFLDTTKDEIYEVAKKELIPFFKNTTPSWSNRGKVRNDIFSKIECNFGKDNFKMGMIKMAKKSKETGELINSMIIQPYLEKMTILNDKTIRIYYSPDYQFIFYEMIFEKIMHSLKKSKIKNKAMTSWYSHIKRNLNWKPFALSKNCTIEIDKNPEYCLIKFK